jgi:hypothetical protein
VSGEAPDVQGDPSHPDQNAPGQPAPERLLDVQVIGDVDLGELVLGAD